MKSVVRQLHEQGTDVVMVDTGNSYEGLCEYLGGTLLSIVGGPENVDRLFSIDSSISTRAGMPKGTAMPCISATCRMKLLPTVWVWHRGHPLICTRMTVKLTPTRCMTAAAAALLPPSPCSPYGVTGKVPISPLWPRCACCMPPNRTSTTSSDSVAGTRCPMKLRRYGIGHPRR